MLDPVTLLATAIRSKLITSTAVTDLVPAEHIRAGSTGPDNTPAIIIGNGDTEIHGHDYAAQRAVWVYLDLHVWTLDAGIGATRAIAFAVTNELSKRLDIGADAYLDHFEVTRAVYPRDPNPQYGHGVISVEALIRWTV